jgi:hypothetical protein
LKEVSVSGTVSKVSKVLEYGDKESYNINIMDVVLMTEMFEVKKYG